MEPTVSDPANPPAQRPAKPARRVPWKLIIFLAVVLAIVLAFTLGGHAAFEWVKQLAEQARNPVTLVILGIAYTVLLAIPGVPGLEVGLVMMVVFGELGIVAVWVCTILGLNTTFFFGRRIPREKLKRWLTPKDVPEHELPSFAVGQADTFTLVLERNKLGRKILKWTGPPGGWRRYALVGFLLNMPGNFIIGGGGGIALFCGTSDDIKWRPYLLTTALAAMPIPLMFYFGLLTVREVLPV